MNAESVTDYLQDLLLSHIVESGSPDILFLTKEPNSFVYLDIEFQEAYLITVQSVDFVAGTAKPESKSKSK